MSGSFIFLVKSSLQTKQLYSDQDPLDEFENDPMTKLKRYAEKNKLRLVDLFRQFDKDNSWSVDREEFINGVRVRSIFGYC